MASDMKDVYSKPGHLIRRAQQISAALFAEECAALDLTPVQYAALVAIRDNPGIDATRVAGLIAFDRSTIGGVLERIAAKGWIERISKAGDKRVKLLELTEAGGALLTQAEAAVSVVQERILAPLDAAEQRQFVALLTKLVRLNNDVSRAPQRLPEPATDAETVA